MSEEAPRTEQPEMCLGLKIIKAAALKLLSLNTIPTLGMVLVLIQLPLKQE